MNMADTPKTTADLLSEALDKWEGLTGVSLEAGPTFSFDGLSVGQMNEMLREALELDPEGATSLLMFEVFLRSFLEDKSFTAAEIMKDFDRTMKFLKEAETLFSIVQGEHAAGIMAAFRAAVVAGLERYSADRQETLEMVHDPDALPFLRLDALRSIRTLTPYQFLAGDKDPAHPQMIRKIYMAWSINDLLLAVRDMPVSGIALVLLRDGAHPERSYFCFVMRNGENITVLTDRTKPAYPGQEDVLSSRGGPGMSRRFASRSQKNHFPYQIIPTSYDDRGDLRFDPETMPVAEGVKLVPLMDIADLPPHQSIWITMMLSLIADRFWHQDWQAPELSYTGGMIRRRELLVEDDGGARLPVASGYRPIELDDVSLDELSDESLWEHMNTAPEGINSWLEKRYRDRVPQEGLNLWGNAAETRYFLSRPSFMEHKDSKEIAGVSMGQGGVLSISKEDEGRLPSFDRPAGYDLATFSEFDFGTESELLADRLFIARKNHAAYICKFTEEEFRERRAEVLEWYRKALEDNFEQLLDLVRQGPDEPKRMHDGCARRLLSFGPVGDERIFGNLGLSDWGGNNVVGGSRHEGNKWRCCMTGSQSYYRANFVPRDIDDLMLLSGKPLCEIPDVLHHWGEKVRCSGNHLLRRMDPMDFDVKNPWRQSNLNLSANIYLSKRGYSRVQKGNFEKDEDL